MTTTNDKLYDALDEIKFGDKIKPVEVKRTKSVLQDIQDTDDSNIPYVYSAYGVAYSGPPKSDPKNGVLLPGQVVTHRLRDKKVEGMSYPISTMIKIAQWNAMVYNGILFCEDVDPENQTFNPIAYAGGNNKTIEEMEDSVVSARLAKPGGRITHCLDEDFPIGIPFGNSTTPKGGQSIAPMSPSEWTDFMKNKSIYTNQSGCFPHIGLVHIMTEKEANSLNASYSILFNPITEKDEYVRPLNIPVGFETAEVLLKKNHTSGSATNILSSAVYDYLKNEVGHEESNDGKRTLVGPNKIGFAWFNDLNPYQYMDGVTDDTIRRRHTKYPAMQVYRTKLPEKKADRTAVMHMNDTSIVSMRNGIYEDPSELNY